jgi:biotin transport system substrate-specific component
MAQQAVSQPTLMDAVWTPGGVSTPFRLGALAVIGTVLLAISAKVQVPFWPVPMTMQSFVVLVLGMAYGWRLAGATLLLYLAEGAIGLPVFASGAGPAYMAGPTGGYLLGFLLAAVALGWLAERGWDRTILWTLLAMVIGNVLIFLPGVAWLSVLMGDLGAAIGAGLTPFLAATVFKTALAAAVLPYAWKLVQRG